MAHMSRLPAVLQHSDLSETELHAAKLDGEVYRVDHCFSPLDEIDGPRNRARSLALMVPSRLIAERLTAAWIHGAISRAPSRHQFCTDITARIRPSALVAITVREVVIEKEDLFELAGLPVTTPIRTAVDLARCGSRFGGDELQAVAHLVRIGEFGIEEVRRMLDRRRNLPHKGLAIGRIEAALRLSRR